jgi:hypothetical protein
MAIAVARTLFVVAAGNNGNNNDASPRSLQLRGRTDLRGASTPR